MRLNMRPSTTSFNLVKYPIGYPEFFKDNPCLYLCFDEGLNLRYSGISKKCSRMVLTYCVMSLLFSVLIIIINRTKKQMVWITTLSIIAGMKDERLRGNLPLEDFPGEAVSTEVRVTSPKLSIPFIHQTASIFPTSRTYLSVKVRHKAATIRTIGMASLACPEKFHTNRALRFTALRRGESSICDKYITLENISQGVLL